jgi:hypothetical protein
MGGRIVRTKTLALTQAGAPPFASFAPLRLCENRRLNKETNLSQSRKDAKAPPLINARLNSRRRYATKI